MHRVAEKSCDRDSPCRPTEAAAPSATVLVRRRATRPVRLVKRVRSSSSFMYRDPDERTTTFVSDVNSCRLHDCTPCPRFQGTFYRISESCQHTNTAINRSLRTSTSGGNFIDLTVDSEDEPTSTKSKPAISAPSAPRIEQNRKYAFTFC